MELAEPSKEPINVASSYNVEFLRSNYGQDQLPSKKLIIKQKGKTGVS
jgi:hypothetical protein